MSDNSLNRDILIEKHQVLVNVRRPFTDQASLYVLQPSSWLYREGIEYRASNEKVAVFVWRRFTTFGKVYLAPHPPILLNYYSDPHDTDRFQTMYVAIAFMRLP